MPNENNKNKMIEMQLAAEQVLEWANKKNQKNVDVLVEKNELFEINILDGKVEKVEQSTSLGLGVRVINNGRTGLASTEKINQKSLKKAFQNAFENSILQDPTEVEMLEAPEKIPDSSLLELYNPELEKLKPDQLVQFGLSIEDSIKSEDSRVVSIPYLGASKSSSESLLLSSRGITNSKKSNQFSAWCCPLLEENGFRKSGMHFLQRREFNFDEGKKIGIFAVNKAVEMLCAKPISGSKLPVVLDEYVAPKLFGMFFSAFYGELAQRGMSRLKEKIGKKISIPGLTLIDDPHLCGAKNSCFIDAEGCITKPLEIIEDGVFRNFLYHVESAKKDDKFSTGHASRSYSSGISTRMHNLVWPKGNYSQEELCNLNKKCLLVTQLEGQAGCNTISGDISIGVQGFFYENSRRIQPVENVTLAGNFFEILYKIQAVGDTYQPEITNFFIPALLVEGFSISG